MKRIFSIFFLLLFMANIIGYYGLLMVTKSHIEQRIARRVENKGAELGGSLIIKIPLNLPYPITNFEEYIDGKGEFTYEHENYRILKQRVYNDSLHIVCVHAPGMEKINNAITDYVKTFADAPAQSKSTLKINISKDYLLSTTSVVSDKPFWSRSLHFGFYTNHYSFLFSSPSLRPPIIFS